MSDKLNEDADKGNVFKMFFYEWERGIMWYPQGESKESFACFLKEQRIQCSSICSSVARNREVLDVDNQVCNSFDLRSVI